MRRRRPYEKRCESCFKCTRLSGTKYVCEQLDLIVIENGRRTENYMKCEKKEKIMKFEW